MGRRWKRGSAGEGPASDIGDAVAPGNLAVQIPFELLVLRHQFVVVAALDIVFYKAEGCLLKFFGGVFRQQRSVDPAQALDGNDHQAAVLLRKLNDFQCIGNFQLQIIQGVDPLQETALFRLGGNNHTILGKQGLEIIGGDLFPGDGSLADSGEHGVGQREADKYLIAGLRIAHYDDLQTYV